MIRKEEYKPGHPILTGADGDNAVKNLLVPYTRVVRNKNDEPVPNQDRACISFNLFKEPKKLSTGQYVYGYVKNRGNWPDIETASEQASKIIKTQDSTNIIITPPVGQWIPITNESCLVTDSLDVKMNDTDKCLRDKAQKEKDEDNKRIMREIREREEECKNVDIYDNPESLAFYAMKRVSEIALTEAINNAKMKLDNFLKTREEKVWILLRQIEAVHPEYRDQWMDRYDEERAKGGVAPYVPSTAQFDEYNNYNPVDLPPIDFEKLKMV